MLNISSSSILSYHQWSTEKFLRIFLLIAIICINIIGNSYIICVLYCRYHRYHTRLHIFLLNLAIGDLTICFGPMTSELFLLFYDQEWILGNIACKLTFYIQVVTIASTTFINVAMTYDRYEAICCPFRSCKSAHHIRHIIALCWLCSFLIAIPQLFIFKQSSFPENSKKYRCTSTGYTAQWQRCVYFTIFASYVLIIPVLCMTIWYIQIIRMISQSTKLWPKNFRGQTTITTTCWTSPTKIRTVKLALTIIIVFVLCWTPYIVTTLIEIYSNGRFRPPNWLDGFFQILCLHQSSLNPFIYILFNQKQKYSPAIILAAASTYSQKYNRDKRRGQGERDGSISLCSLAETPLRNQADDKKTKFCFVE